MMPADSCKRCKVAEATTGDDLCDACQQTEDQYYAEWLQALDSRIADYFGGLTHSNFPDLNLRDWFNEGMLEEDAFDEWLSELELRIDRRDYDDEGD